MIHIEGKPCRLIATEEHYVARELLEATGRIVSAGWQDLDLADTRFFLHDPRGRAWFEPLVDLEEGRLRMMDEAGVDVAILSLMAPGVQFFEPETAASLAVTLNDHLAETIRRHPTRYGGLAVVAPQAPERAAKEIERAMRTLKLNGLVINSHTGGEYLDHPKFWPILEAAEATGAAIYLHPRNPPPNVQRLLEAPDGRPVLGSGIWGFQMETSLHALRLIVCGVFDRFPKLKVVLGHMGEGLPYWLYRLDYMYERGYRKQGTGLAKRLPSEYVRDNFFITISGMNDHRFSQPTLAYCHSIVGPDRILFASDHPFQSTQAAVDVLRNAPFSRQDIEQIAHRNSESVFHMAPA
ncbi:amidohydrolase family protein [Hyalangium sp.]|uniref:amidohydrolase family protein n=1 Tax=Hyalangium sp. TaxID=2028555 RepID=UPI002D23F81D|nr:amidohydrolase family protein [Hyalangium sp.]HYH97948.1 amidohydrolase family protein [Hyalangium sp.]